jgi:hypothetical protein
MADNNYDLQSKVYTKQGAAELIVASGGALRCEVGSIRSLNGSDVADTVTFAPAAGASNVCEITITVKNGAGTATAAPTNLDVWLSDAATGAGLTATTASGAVTAKTSSGAVLGTYTAKMALRVQTLATGVFILSITDTAKTGFYVCATVPGSGATAVSAQLVTGNYG